MRVVDRQVDAIHKFEWKIVTFPFLDAIDVRQDSPSLHGIRAVFSVSPSGSPPLDIIFTLYLMKQLRQYCVKDRWIIYYK